MNEVKCPRCGNKSRMSVYKPFQIDCPFADCLLRSPPFTNEQAAIDWWKRSFRVPDTAAIERAERYKTALEHYADDFNWDWHGDTQNVYRPGNVSEVRGPQIAQAALGNPHRRGAEKRDDKE